MIPKHTIEQTNQKYRESQIRSIVRAQDSKSTKWSWTGLNNLSYWAVERES